jgi:hypothetical protein
MNHNARWIDWLRSGSRRIPRRTTTRKRLGLSVEALEGRVVPATLIVNSVLDSTTVDTVLTLREAIAAANSGPEVDSIGFAAALNGQAIKLTLGQLTVTNPLMIMGNGAANTILDGQGNSRLFDVLPGAGDFTLAGLTLRNGQTATDGANGGAVLFESAGTLTLRDSTVSNNSTEGMNSNGGAIASATGSVSIIASTLSSSSTEGDSSVGGAVFVDSGALSIVGSTIEGNFTAGVASLGGAIAANSATVSISASTLSGNQTRGLLSSGAALIAESGAVTVTNSTMAGNATTGPNSSGGALISFGGPITVQNSTIAFNRATRGGGGVFSDSASITLVSSIVARNTDDAGIAPDVRQDGTLVVDHSLVGINSGTDLTPAIPPQTDANGSFVGSADNPVDPLLGPLQNNGGPTETDALLYMSPARGAGSNPLELATDQRGLPRQSGNLTDMGAYEVNAAAAYYVAQLFGGVLGRVPDAAGFQHWIQQLDQGVSRSDVAQGFLGSSERLGLEVDTLYAAILHRPAEAGGRAAWIQALQSGLNAKDAAAMFLASDEYSSSHVGFDAFVGGLYQDVLGRQITPAELAGWATATGHIVEQPHMISAFLNSTERGLDIVSSYYRTVLSRSASDVDTHYWLARLQAGATADAVGNEFLASDEFYSQLAARRTDYGPIGGDNGRITVVGRGW